MRGIIPIHLPEEGYSGYVVLIDGEQVSESIARAFVDPQEDWVVKLDIRISEDEALYEPCSHELSIFATSGLGNDFQVKSDLIVKARLIVLPVELPASWTVDVEQN
jgi:hypothetical protein